MFYFFVVRRLIIINDTINLQFEDSIDHQEKQQRQCQNNSWKRTENDRMVDSSHRHSTDLPRIRGLLLEDQLGQGEHRSIPRALARRL